MHLFSFELCKFRPRLVLYNKKENMKLKTKNMAVQKIHASDDNDKEFYRRMVDR